MTARKARPILMSGPMVRALIDGTKTQTRRIVKLPCGDEGWEAAQIGGKGVTDAKGNPVPVSGALWHPKTALLIGCPYGQPGDFLWCRETYTLTQHGKPVYRADATDQTGARWHSIQPGDPAKEVVWKPSIHMPRWASRITLEITDVRVQPLQSISETDAMVEGVKEFTLPNGVRGYWGAACETSEGFKTPYYAYAALWESINGPGAWAENPWVWALTFKRHMRNVDDLLGDLQ